MESRYPEIGQEKPGVVKVLRKLSDEGNKIILWTVRTGYYLEEAIEWCLERDLEFYADNANHPDGVNSHRIVAKSLKMSLMCSSTVIIWEGCRTGLRSMPRRMSADENSN